MHFTLYQGKGFGGEIKEYISQLQLPYKVSFSSPMIYKSKENFQAIVINQVSSQMS